MKDWIRRWLGTEKPLTRDFEDLGAAAIEALAKSKDAHISDLRVLIDKGHERETQLSRLVEMAMEHQFYRPQVTGARAPENRAMPAIPADSMTDVAVFDEEEDAEHMRREQAQAKILQDELAKLTEEQNEKGITKVQTHA